MENTHGDHLKDASRMWESAQWGTGKSAVRKREEEASSPTVQRAVIETRLDNGFLKMTPVRGIILLARHTLQVTNAQVRRVVSLAKHKLRCIKGHLRWL